MRVVYDTNVLVSAALKPASIPAVLVSLALAQRVHLCVSPPILSEYTAGGAVCTVTSHRLRQGLSRS